MREEKQNQEMFFKEGIVKAISQSDRYNSFCFEEDEKQWYTLLNERIEDIISKGDKIKIFYIENGNQKEIKKIDIIKKREKKSEEWQDEIISFETLLNDAHIKLGGFSIFTQLIHHDFDKKTAMFKAQVKIMKHKDENSMQIFEAHGDADQDNCGDMIKPHYIRMAETRAIARALRFATNNAKTAEEEKN